MIVQVYRNLHKNCWSIRDKKTRRVIDYRSTISLNSAKFKVSEAGRQRVIKELRKNVHAIIEGKISRTSHRNKIKTQIIYNPYKFKTFVTAKNNNPVYNANVVYMTKGQVFIA